MKKLFVLFTDLNITLLWIIFLSPANFPQELDCSVIVNYESLPVANRELLIGFDEAVETYMNMTRFTDEDWQGPRIPCTLNIFFTSASSDVNYSAQVVVVSQRPIFKSINFSPMLTVNDNSWSFTYEKGQSLYGNRSTFDPLTSFLDYYANVIIGFDMDSFVELGGTPYFAKAFDIVNLGNSSSFSAGWQSSSANYSRWGLVSDLLNEKFRPFREAFYNYHLNGIDIFVEHRNIALGQITGLISTLEEMRTKVDLNTVLMKAFFDAKYGEIADYIKHAKDPGLISTLKRIDPRHITKYDEVLNEIQ